MKTCRDPDDWGRSAAWRLEVLAIIAAAVLVRLLIVAHTHGGVDLRMYTYFSRLALHGANPFAPPPSASFPALDSNNPPAEVALFTGVLALRDSPTALRLLFVLADALVLALIGLCFARSRRWRRALLLFYGLNPFVLVSFTAFAEDKSLLFLGIACWLLALERGREWGAWACATALAALKFLGAFAAPALALHGWRRRRVRALAPIAAAAAGSAVSNLPWFPRSLDAFPRRDARLALDPPIHASPTLLLSRAGLYAPVEARLLSVAALAALLGLLAARRIEIREAVVGSIAAGYAFLPDDAANRLLLVTLPFLLLLDLSWRRWVAVWAVSCAAALGAVVATRGVPQTLAFAGAPLRAAFAHESTVRHVLWANLLPALVLALYVRERRAGRAPVGSLASRSAQR